ncbi:hypothetical protein O9929_25785 [Vibrio lentus]|nr:hypothetical protein [Vibrio lentus]
MLALPLASAGIGFSTSLFLMLCLWALMVPTRFINGRASSIRRIGRNPTHFSSHAILGNKGKWTVSFAVMFVLRFMRPLRAVVP